MWIKYCLIIAVLLWGFALPALAQENIFSNIGFVPGNVWFSKIPFFAGDKVRIYTVIFNGTENDFTGTVEFYDNQATIGKINFSSSGGEKIKNIWVDWTPEKGNHKISTKIVNAKISRAGEQEKIIILKYADATTENIFADSDTDQDGIGDAEDTDDDNDALSDEQELKIGTDPLIADTDKDGVKDGEEIKKGSDPLKISANEKSAAAATKNEIENKNQISSLALPPIITESAKVIAQKTEGFRKSRVENLDEKIQEIKNESSVSPQKEPTSTENAYLALLSALRFVINIKLLFYIASIIALYYFLKLTRKISFRKNK